MILPKVLAISFLAMGATGFSDPGNDQGESFEIKGHATKLVNVCSADRPAIPRDLIQSAKENADYRAGVHCGEDKIPVRISDFDTESGVSCYRGYIDAWQIHVEVTADYVCKY